MIKYITILLICFGSVLSHAQSQVDTLEMAREFLATDRPEVAFGLLEKYCVHHKNEWSFWLLGSSAHECKKYHTARKAYAQALLENPHNDGIKIDFANKLLAQGKMVEAKKMLSTIENSASIYYQDLFVMAQIYYWELNYEQAKAKIAEYIRIQGNTKEAEWLQQDIQKASGLFLTSDNLVLADNQPYQHIYNQLKLNTYKSNILQPSVYIANFDFISEQKKLTTAMVGVGNSILIEPLMIRGNVSVGAHISPEDKTTMIGTANISRTFFNDLKWDINYNRSRYLNTIASRDTNISTQTIGSYLEYSGRFFTVNVSGSKQYYNDGNTGTSQAIWAMVPLSKLRTFKLNIGYAYAQSQTETDTYSSIKSIDGILQYYYSDDYVYGDSPVVEGHYATYYSPHKQKVHSLFCNTAIVPISKLTLRGSATYGFQATEAIPYLYLGADANDESIVVKEYSDGTFNPLNLNASAEWAFSKFTSLSMGYTYSKSNYYYYSQTVKLTAILKL